MHPTESEWMMASHLSDGCRHVAERVNCSLEGEEWKCSAIKWFVIIVKQYEG